MQVPITRARVIQALAACLVFFAPLLLVFAVPRDSLANAWRLVGMEGSKVDAVYALRSGGETRYLCTTSGLGVWHLADGRWRALNGGLPTGAWGQVPRVHLAAHDGEQIRLYLALGERADSVGFYAQTYPASWALLRVDFGKDVVRAVALESDPNLLYAATGRHIYRSADGGLTWQRLEGPAAASAPSVLVVHPRSPGELWLGTSRGEVYISRDRGQTWALSLRLSLERVVNSIAIDPVEPNMAYMAAGASVYATTDGGQTWTRRAAGLGSGFAVALLVDPAVRGTVFLGTNPDGVYWSNNYARTWQPFREGMGRLGVNSLALDPLDNETLLAGTDNGVWARSLAWMRSGARVTVPPPYTPTPLPPTESPTPTRSPTWTPTPTRTRLPSPTATATLAPTATPARTATVALSPTATFSPTPSPTAVVQEPTRPAPTFTPTAPGPSPTPTPALTATPTLPPR